MAGKKKRTTQKPMRSGDTDMFTQAATGKRKAQPKFNPFLPQKPSKSSSTKKAKGGKKIVPFKFGPSKEGNGDFFSRSQRGETRDTFQVKQSIEGEGRGDIFSRAATGRHKSKKGFNPFITTTKRRLF